MFMLIRNNQFTQKNSSDRLMSFEKIAQALFNVIFFVSPGKERPPGSLL